MDKPKVGVLTSPLTNKEFSYIISKEYKVVQSNELIQNNYFVHDKNKGSSLTLTEKKIILYLISKIKPTDTNLEPQNFELIDFCKTFGINLSGGKSYKALKETLENLMRTIWLWDGETLKSARWIDYVEIKPYKGTIKLKLDDKMKPYLLDVKSNFTKYGLINIIRMKSKYGIMLYELLKSYIFRGNSITFTIEDLKNRLDCTNYKTFQHFKTRVIEPAMQDINRYSDILAIAKYKKTGREFTEITFTVIDLSTPEYFEEQIARRLNTEREIERKEMKK